MLEIFSEYKTLIIFLHVISAVVWVGGMIAMRYAAHPAFMSLDSSEERLSKVTYALKRLFIIVFPFIVILLLTAVIMLLGYDIKSTEYASVAYVKEGIFIVMCMNYLCMIFRRNKAVKFLAKGDTAGAKSAMLLVSRFVIPLNILLGVVAIYLGSSLSSSL